MNKKTINSALQNRVMTPKEFQMLTGYNIAYVYTLNRQGDLKSFKEDRLLLLDFNYAIKYISQAKRDVKTGKVRRNKKPRVMGNIIKMFRKKPGSNSEALAV